MDIKEPTEDGEKDPLPGDYGFPLPKELFYREIGFGGFFGYHNNPRYNVGKKVVTQSLSTKAVHTLCTKELTRRRFNLPNGARTTFHIAFSPDGSKVASCHGDHNVYVCEVASGDVIQTLSGHPRTPWCVVFHPSQNDVLASGCLAGQVRVWDLKGGSETLVTDSGTVIASLAFHPTVRLLAIATFNEIIFWDWAHPYPLARCSTENTKEKVRLVRFDRFGHSLITGITNFPSPPCREEIRRPVRGGSGGSQGPFLRPNILSRNYRARRSSPVFGSSRDDTEMDADDGEGEVVEEVVVPDPEEPDGFGAADDTLMVRESLNARQDRFQESYRQLVSHYEELVSNYQQFLRSRIPRIYESAENENPPPAESALVLNEESMDAEPHIVNLSPVNPEVEINSMDAAFEPELLSNSTSPPSMTFARAPELEPTEESTPVGTVTVLESPSSPTVMDDEVPGPSRLLFETTEDTTMEAPTEEEPVINETSEVPSTSADPSNDSSESTEAAPRSDTDLRNIEALAQNILEMQNLCSQVRMDAPLSVENQHIVELRVIRRHLELLQEQTRDLQSSIRATLNSLATGSLAALRSHVANAANNALVDLGENSSRIESPITQFPNLEQATPPTPAGEGPNMDFESHTPPLSPLPRPSTSTEASSSSSEVTSRRVRVEVNTPAQRSGGNGGSSSGRGTPNTLYRIMIATPYSESGRMPNAPFSRIRVPPMVAMQYELPDSQLRNQQGQGASRNAEEPVPGTSRDRSIPNERSRNANDPQANPGPGPRRIVREFHLVGGRPASFVAEEHSRHCPFSGSNPYQWRPPPRMRSLYDMGEMPPLVQWPTMETVESSTRSFRMITSSSSTGQRNPSSQLTITVRNGYGGVTSSGQFDNYRVSSNRVVQFMNYNQWLLSGGITCGGLMSDVLVSIYLTIRQLNTNNINNPPVPVRPPQPNNEQWQQVFGNVVPGLALIPPNLRQGQRPVAASNQLHRCHTHTSRRRRTHWICCNHSGTSSHVNRPCSLSHTRASARNANVASTSNNTSTNQDDQSGAGSSGTTGTTPATHSSGSSTLRIQIQNLSAANAPDESSSSNSNSSSGYSSSSSEALGLRAARKVSEVPVSAPRTESTAPLPRTIPTQLERNFSRVFYIRAPDELIPVYSTVNNSESGLGTEVRESMQASVYYLPIGLFLQGGPWQANTQTVGIHWPPVTREEEYAALDLRVSERPLAVYETSSRVSLSNNRRYPRIRLDYDQTSLRVTLPTGFTLQFIQSGLTLLDCISSSVNLPRPRAVVGTLWIDYLAPFLDSLERMFGLRHARRSLMAVPPTHHHRVGAFLRRAPAWPPENGRPTLLSREPGSAPQQGSSSSFSSPGASGSSGSQDNSSSNPSRQAPVASSSRRAELGDRLRSMATRRIITLAPDSQIDSRGRRYYEDAMLLSHGYYGRGSGGEGGYRGGEGSDRRFYFRHRHRGELGHHHHHHHHGSGPSSSQSSGNGQGRGGREGSDGNRFIRFAVDTAASEVLSRRHHYDADSSGFPVVEAGSASGFSTIGRPVESRIERVLNERGNRGVHANSPPRMLDENARNRMRLEEIQMRISMFSQWSRARAMATSGTQTPPSFIRGGWPSSSHGDQPSTSGSQPDVVPGGSERDRGRRSGDLSSDLLSRSVNYLPMSPGRSDVSEPRASRRRPHSRMGRFLPSEVEENSDEELLSVPARIPRFSDQPPQPQGEFDEGRNRSESPAGRREGGSRPESPASRRAGGMGSRHWDAFVMRSIPSSVSRLQRYRSLGLVELAGSARTRAAPQNRFSAENNAEPNPADNIEGNESPRARFHRASRSRAVNNPAGNNDGNNNSVGNDRDEQNLDAGARFYPGYIPEILITPRTRPPTYYTMDAATTAFLSSRIQKWDFTEFLIPDITKRDEYVVVRECSLHSDACLDVSPDSEFLAVLQPSDSGSYSSVGIYSLRDESLGELLNVYHFDQNTVSVSIAPSCDYLVVGYAGRGPLYRFVHPSRNIGKIISIARDEDEGFKLVHVKDLYADGQVAFMSINCMHWVPVSGYGIIYGTNTGDLVLLS